MNAMPETTDLIERPDRVYIQLAENGSIRVSLRDPFEGGTAYIAATALSEKDAENATLRARLASCEAALKACDWYWPEDDTSSECCHDSKYEVVDNHTSQHGEVIAVARGGVVEVTYCASLPPADDADSDDDFWVEEQTHESAKAKIEAERIRRAALTKGGEDA